jgi:hypothetical protein
VLGEEGLGHGTEGDLVFRSREAVPLVAEGDVRDWHLATPERRHHLLRLGARDAHILEALGDQDRPGGAIDVGEG